MKRNAQAAMEFVMTYGWAILAVLVAIGALSYFGVMNPSKYFPEKCLFSSGINCKDFKVEENTATSIILYVTLENDLQETVYLQNVSISSKLGIRNDTCISGKKLFTQNNATRIICTLPAGSNPGKGNNALLNVMLVYSDVGAGSFTHTVQGEVQSKVQ